MKRIALALAAVLMIAAPALAQAPPTVIRGVVKLLRPDAVVIRGRDGKVVTVKLSRDWAVAVTKPISVDAIQPGSFIGTAEMPQANGVGRSLEVHIFPPGVKIGEGHYGWNLRKGSMMTNGTVGKVVAGRNGRELDVSYSTGTRHIVVPPKVPIVEITGGERSQVKPGVPVFLVAQPAAGGGLMTNSLSIGVAGRPPPM